MKNQGMEMEATFLTGDAVRRAISRLIAEHEELHWAVAWGTDMPIAAQLLKNIAKCKNVTFGLAFCQTDPKFVDALVGLKNCYVATRFAGGTYHPKVYCFRSGDKVSAVVGSANFTRGGMGKNHEACVELRGTMKDDALADLLTFTKESAKLGQRVTRSLADRYKLSCKRAERVPKPPRDPIAAISAATAGSLGSPLVTMTWSEYSQKVRNGGHHDIDGSLALLRTAQMWLARARSFHDLPPAHRKALAGVLGESQKSDAELDQEWGWFGSMRGAGDFANRIGENDTYMARAVDSIPQRGAVTRTDYDRFAKQFVRAFRSSQRTGGVATASRLLAMKRPDVFLCISKPNLSRASSEMGFAKNLVLEDYWDRVVEVIRAAEWYNAEKPDGPDGELWENRAAMLDAYLYEP
jgi:HKD family nuclease